MRAILSMRLAETLQGPEELIQITADSRWAVFCAPVSTATLSLQQRRGGRRAGGRRRRRRPSPHAR